MRECYSQTVAAQHNMLINSQAQFATPHAWRVRSQGKKGNFAM